MRYAVLCALVGAVAYGQMQSPTGTVQGAVADVSKFAVPGAQITAVNAERGVRRATRTDPTGMFTLPGLNIGSWVLTVEAPGFATVQTQPFSVSVGQVVVQRFELRPATMVEKMEVSVDAGVVDMAASSASVALGYERIEEAPARSRNYLNFVLAAPAVTSSAGAASQRTMTGVRSPLADSGFSFGGMRPRNNSVRIDGIDNRDETTGGNRVAVGLEMVEEFRVSGTSVGAELGGAAGGLLNMVTRSGVNLWHGDVTWFMQNNGWNARKPEVDPVLRPRFIRRQPGASAMGPLRKDKTFIAAAIEEETEKSDELSNIPSEAVIAIQSVPFSRDRDEERGLYPTSTRGREFSAKLDHQFSATDTVSARYAYSRGKVLNEVQGPDNFAARTAQGSSLTIDHSLVGSWFHVAGPKVVNDLRGQVSERTMNLWPNGRGPMFEIPGVATFGQYYRMDGERTERHYEIVESFHVVLGAHRLNAGADIHTVKLDASLRDRYAGVFVFPSIDAYLAGRPGIYTQAFGDPRTRMNTTPLGAWLQDRWEVRQGFSVELGMRYEHQTLPSRFGGTPSNFAPRAGLSWKPLATKPLVVRVGAGLFHDRYPLAWLNQALQKDGVQGYEQYATGNDAMRALSLSAGQVLTFPVPAVPRSTYTAYGLDTTYGRKVAAGVEYELNKDTSLSLEATSIHGLHLPRMRNAALTLPTQYVLETASESTYRGATLTLNRRLSHEVAALISYSIGKTRDNASDFDEQPQDPRNAKADWGPSRQDQQHRFSSSLLFELPVDWIPGVIGEALEQISVAPIFTAGSGRPLNTLLTSDVYGTGAYPISARPVGMMRNMALTPTTVSLDVRVMKTIPLFEKRAVLQFGLESFNALNHTNVERVSPYFGLPSFGGIIESLPARQLQFMTQFEF